jgi:hypothetical protein
MNNAFIVMVLSIAFFITVFKLQQGRGGVLWEAAFHTRSFAPSNPVDNALCPVLGYECADEKRCDCERICGPDFERVRIEAAEEVFSSNVRRGPGTYCFPKGFYDFKPRGALFRTTGEWRLASKHPHVWDRRGQLIACRSPLAKDDLLNVLMDHSSGRQVREDETVDPDELLPDGSERYACWCNSKDLRGNSMISLPEFPFVCLPDPCKREVSDATFLGWDGTKCDCGPDAENLDPDDLASPCVSRGHVLEDERFRRFVPCTDERGWYRRRDDAGFYCPAGETTFEKVILFLDSPIDVLHRLIKKRS